MAEFFARLSFFAVLIAVTAGGVFAQTPEGTNQPSDGSLPPGFQEQPQTVSPDQAPEQAPEQAPVVPQEQPQFPQYDEAAAPTGGTAVGSDQYVYDPTGRRDPFRPYRILRVGSDQTGDKGGEAVLLEPLQTYDIDQLTILGILWDVRQPRALVQDGDGKVHTLVKHTKIGRNNGYVAAIREGEVVVIEAFEDGERIVKKTRVMEFRK